MAHVGYLHLSKELLMCSSSLLCNCVLVQVVLALCVSELKTLYFTERLY